MSNHITHFITQFAELQQEIKRKQREIKELKEIRDDCSTRIQDYLREHDLPGIKHNGITILTQTSQRRQPLKKENKLENAKRILQGYGIEDTDDALNELFESMKGDMVEKHNLRIL